MPKIVVRMLSGSVYVAMIIAAVYFNYPWFVILMALFSLLSLLEVIGLTHDQASSSMNLTALVYSGIIIYLCMFQQLDQFSWHYYLAFAIQILALVMIYINMRSGKMPALLFNTLYIWLPLAALAIWSVQNSLKAVDHLLFMFILIWVNDSFAYLVGKAIGKRKIFPKVSPNKTIEGTIGGVVFTMISGYLMSAYWLNLDVEPISSALLISVCAIWGDFFESYLKRRLDIKDSGNLMPGHGGILDRIDSLLFVALPYIVMLSLS